MHPINKKKICFVVSSITNNGVTRVLSILLDEIDYDSFDVTVLLTKRAKHIRNLNKKAKIIEGQPLNCKGIIGRFKTMNSIHKILLKENFDKIIALGDYAAMYMLLGGYGIKTEKVISERNDPNSEPSKKIYRKIRDLIYKSADIMVCQTNDASKYYDGIVKKRIIIYNPIMPNLPTYDGKRDKRVVNFCRIDSQKNLPLLLDAFSEFHKEHSDYTLEVYGNGPLKNEIENYIKDNNMESFVSLKDFCEDIHEKIKSAAMFVSSSDFEGMSNSMLEAMGMGMPVICTDCPIGGAHEVIKSGFNGILVPCRDKKNLISAMKKIAENEKFGDFIGSNAIKINFQLDKKTICEKWWEILNN